MIRNGVQSGAINAMNAINAKLISLYKHRSYGQRLEMLEMDHTLWVSRLTVYFVSNFRTRAYSSHVCANV
jgi:hypothetical protein